MNINSANEIKREQNKQAGRELRHKFGVFFNRGDPGEVPWSLVPHGPTTGPLAGPKQVKMAAPRSNETQENAHAFESA
jgi:hypothetical protein